MKKMTRKISALILAFVMTAGVIPTSVMADIEVVNAQETEVEVTPSLEVGNEYTITFAEDGAKEIWYQFNPAESGHYTVVSNGEYDSYCELYNSDKDLLAIDDDGAGSSNFYLQYEMTAGTIYYYKFRMYSEDIVGSYKVNLIKNVSASSIKLDSNSCTAYVGTYLYLSVEFLPELAVVENISWTSSDESVASVDEYGNVDLLSAGETVITATSASGLSDSCNVTVKPAVDAALNTTYSISTDGENNRGILYKFVPEESRYYRFYTFNSECDTYGILYDENLNELTNDDQSGEGSHFTIDYELKAGETYYIYARPYDDKDIISFDFTIKEINPTKLKDIYFTVDNVKQEEFGFTVTEASEVTLWLGFSLGDDIEISSVTWGGRRIDKEFKEDFENFVTEYDAEKNLYYTKIPADLFIDGCDFSVNDVMVYDIKDDVKDYKSINGTSLDTVFYYMGENTSTKSYKVYWDVLNNTSEVSVTTPRVTSLAEMGIEIPEVPVIEGAEFIGWDLLIGGNSYGLIKSNDQKFSISNIFDQANDEMSITLKAKYDKNIVKGHFRYKDKDGSDAEKIVLAAVDKNQEVTFAQWLESVIAGNQLSDIEHTTEMNFDGWEIGDDSSEYTVDSEFTEINVDAEYVFDGIIIDGAEDGKTYYRPVTINVIDNDLESITVNGEPVEDMSAPIVLDNGTPGTYVISVKDASENVVEVTITLNPLSDIAKPIEDKNVDNVVPENKSDLEAAKADLEKALEENSGNYTDSEKQEIADKIESIDKALEVLVNTVIVYFDNSETNWEYVFACYEDENGELILIGTVEPDKNGICTVRVPVDCKIQFWNYLPGQPPEAAPEEGFLQTDFMDVEDGKTYKYEAVTTVQSLGDVNADTIINAQDALLVLQHAAKLITLTDEKVVAANVNTDESINASDALMILQYAADLIDSF